ncbi:scavenger receptor class F member 2 isoform X2 [Patella vulgata]|nr:scavenger receptor class F member 2 isoform X2 [Patella vulgata]
MDCGNCLGNSICKSENGHCQSGCAAGYQPPLCKSECEEGTFGGDCGGICLTGCKNGQCNRVTGICNNGCISGYLGKLCNVECPVGSYGDGCINRCSDGCNNTCDFQTGKCGCKIGYNGTLCHECPVGTYGMDCLSSCENCPSGVCDRLNGSCPYSQQINTDTYCSEWIIYGIPIVSVVIAVIVIIIAVLCVARTNRTARKHSLAEEKLGYVHCKLNTFHGRTQGCVVNSAADDTTDNVPDPSPPQSGESDIRITFSSHQSDTLSKKNKSFTTSDEDGYIRSISNVAVKKTNASTTSEDEGYIKSERYVGFNFSQGVVSAKPSNVNANDDGENYMNVITQPLPGQGEELYVNITDLEETPSTPIYENYRKDVR